MGLFCCSSSSSKRSKHAELEDNSETPRNDYRYQNHHQQNQNQHQNQNQYQNQRNPYNDIRMDREPLPNTNNYGGNAYQQNIDRYRQQGELQQQYGGNNGNGSSAGAGGNRMPPLRNPRGTAATNNADANAKARSADVFPELAEWRLDETEVLLTRKISTGAFGVVWLGHYHGQPVAVKRMIEGGEEVGFSREIQTMAQLVHPKVVRFLGCTWSSIKDLSAVTEFMDGGDVRTLLENRKIDLTWEKQKISIAIDVAEALAYMHSKSPKVIHRDLKSRNVLLNAQLVAKLSDFGLSRNRTYEETLTAGVGTVRWTAPEVMLGENYSEQADVYSFGVVLSELDTREIPFEEKGTSRSGAPGAPDMAIVIKVAKGELRPTFSPECPEPINKIAKACLQFDPALRPSASSVVRMLTDAKAQLLMQ